MAADTETYTGNDADSDGDTDSNAGRPMNQRGRSSWKRRCACTVGHSLATML